MPIYDYKCNNCGNETDEMCEWEDADKQVCEVCGETLTRLLSVFSTTIQVHTRGGGYFDRGLGCYVESERHRQQVMDKLGVMPADKVTLDENEHKEITEHKKHEEAMSIMKSEIKRGADSMDALDKAYNIQ